MGLKQERKPPKGRADRGRQTRRGSLAKKNAAVFRGEGPGAVAPGIGGSGTALGNDDLDAPVLRLTHAVRRRHPEIVLAAAADRHVAARYTQSLKGGGDSIGAPLGEPLVVAGRA